jgi:hypothetical protein
MLPTISWPPTFRTFFPLRSQSRLIRFVLLPAPLRFRLPPPRSHQIGWPNEICRLGQEYRANDISEFRSVDAIRQKICFRFHLYTSLAVTAASPIAPVRFLMQMSARNAFSVRYVFDSRSHDRLAQRSSGLRVVFQIDMASRLHLDA